MERSGSITDSVSASFDQLNAALEHRWNEQDRLLPSSERYIQAFVNSDQFGLFAFCGHLPQIAIVHEVVAIAADTTYYLIKDVSTDVYALAAWHPVHGRQLDISSKTVCVT